MTSITDNYCIICQSGIDPNNTKIVHKSDNWSHQFCSPCIDDWIHACLEKDKEPSCPLCPDFKISPKLFPLPKVKSDYEIARGTAMDRYDWLISDIINTNSMQVCMGIMFCINDTCIYRFTNCDTNFNMFSTLRDMQDWVRTKGRQIYNILGFTSRQNIAYNSSVSNWLTWRYPSIRITDVHYSMPPYTHRVGTFQDVIDPDLTLSEMYIQYQTLAGLMHLSAHDYSEAEQYHLKKIYQRANLAWNGVTGPDDPGHYDRAYCNNENPVIPVEYRAFRYNAKSTENSMAWLTFHLEYE